MSAQQPIQGKIQIRKALLVFCKDCASPLVLYFDEPENAYENIKQLINSTEVKMVDFEPIGPIKKASVLSNNIIAVAMQEERYMVQE